MSNETTRIDMNVRSTQPEATPPVPSDTPALSEIAVRLREKFSENMKNSIAQLESRILDPRAIERDFLLHETMELLQDPNFDSESLYGFVDLYFDSPNSIYREVAHVLDVRLRQNPLKGEIIDRKTLLSDPENPNSGSEIPSETLSYADPVLSIYKKTAPELYTRVLESLWEIYVQQDNKARWLAQALASEEVSRVTLHQLLSEIYSETLPFHTVTKEDKEIISHALFNIPTSESYESDLDFAPERDTDFIRAQKIWKIFVRSENSAREEVERLGLTKDDLLEIYHEVVVEPESFGADDNGIDAFAEFINSIPDQEVIQKKFMHNF